MCVIYSYGYNHTKLDSIFRMYDHTQAIGQPAKRFGRHAAAIMRRLHVAIYNASCALDTKGDVRMRPLVIACSILKDEITTLFDKHNLEDVYNIRWMPESLHTFPQKMTGEIQSVIDEETDRPFIMLTYGNCGNGLVGICAREVPVIMPRYADCISMLLSERDDLDKLRTNTFFLTRGWMDGEYSIEKEYDGLVEKKGQKRADKIINMLYEHYDNLMLIDTGCYDMDAQAERLETVAKKVHMKPCTSKGTISIWERLLTQDWDDDFIRLEPGDTVAFKDYFPI